jgi:hypothetical protein
MRTEATFTVESFTPAELSPAPLTVDTAAPVGVAVMVKEYTGGVVGRSATIFTAAFDQGTGTGTYVAMESFEGVVDGAVGTFSFVHAATTEGGGRAHEHFAIVPGSGTGELTGIRGGGGLLVEDDGTHRVWFDWEPG